MTISPKAKIIIVLAGIGVVVILAFFSIGQIGSPRWSSRLDSAKRAGEAGRITPSPTSTPTPTPLPLAPGKQVYGIRSDSASPGPLISEATFDPLDVEKGSTIAVTVKAKDASSITITMIDDSGKSEHALTLVSGVWSGSWKVESTHNRIYAATITATNSKGEKRSVELWFR